MVKIFLNLLLRNFLKDKLLNSLNIIGLALGLTAAMLIVLYADHELSFDEFHPDGDNIYRMEARTNNPIWFSTLGMEHGRELISGKYPEVRETVELNNSNQTFFSYGQKRFLEKQVNQVAPGSSFLDFFGFELIQGDAKSALEAPHSVILTKTTAQKYFENEQAIGKVLKFNSISLTVTGIIEDLPTNTHLSFDVLYTNPTTFGQDHFHTNTYVKLVNGASATSLEEKILAMEGVALDEFHELSEVSLIPVADIYFESQAGFGSGGQGDKMQLSIFMVIGALILLISVANYINLSLAIYSGKGMEIGMRKVLGESKNNITRAFFFESLIMALLTIPLLLVGLKLVLPEFNRFMGLEIQNQLLSSPAYWIILISFLGLLSAFTVIYPSLTLAKRKVSLLLKSKASIHTTGGVKLRNVLIFIQFILLFTLGISAWFMNRQLNYLGNKDMGFDAQGVIKITNAFAIGDMSQYKLLKNELMNSPLVAGVAFGPMMGDGMNPLAYKPEGHDDIYENLLSYGVEIDYFEVMGMEVLAGEFKNKLISADSGEIISLVNQNFIRQYGWEDDPIGKKIILRPGTENELHRTVSAVFKDFHFYTLKEKITPQIISLRNDPRFVNTNILVKAGSQDLKEVVQAMEEAWNEIQPETPMQYDFMDDAVKRLYLKEQQTGRITILFSLLAVSLSLLGLIGFMVYIIGLKSKEIAVRKVLGASLLQIIGLLNRQLFVIILIAAVLGSTLSYLLVDTWLRDYAYAIILEPVTFLLAAILVYLIVFVITGLQSFKSAQLNPTLALKNE